MDVITLQKDQNAASIQNPVQLVFQDATATPNTSPKSVTTSVTLLPPANAINLVIEPSATVTIGYVGGTGTFSVPAGLIFPIPVIEGVGVVVTGTCTLNFFFQCGR